MREFHIGKNDENQRLDRFLGKAIPLLPASLAQKYIRLKRIKVNGARAQRDQKLVAGDILQCYINDEFFESPSEENVYLTITTPRLKIVYEDENIMLLDQPAGMLAHADEHEKEGEPRKNCARVRLPKGDKQRQSPRERRGNGGEEPRFPKQAGNPRPYDEQRHAPAECDQQSRLPCKNFR